MRRCSVPAADPDLRSLPPGGPGTHDGSGSDDVGSSDACQHAVPVVADDVSADSDGHADSTDDDAADVAGTGCDEGTDGNGTRVAAELSAAGSKSVDDDELRRSPQADGRDVSRHGRGHAGGLHGTDDSVGQPSGSDRTDPTAGQLVSYSSVNAVEARAGDGAGLTHPRDISGWP